MAKIKLGDKVRCKVSGFEGIAVTRSLYLNGCERWDIQPRVDKDGKPQKGIYVDIQQLERVKEKAVEVKSAKTGGAMGISEPDYSS